MGEVAVPGSEYDGMGVSSTHEGKETAMTEPGRPFRCHDTVSQQLIMTCEEVVS